MGVAHKGLALLLVASAVAGAQNPGRGGRGLRGGGNRDSLGSGMQAVGQAVERLVRKEVQPTDDQMMKIRQIDQRMRPRRQEIDRDEQQVRRDLRQAMTDTANINQERIGQLLDRMVAFPRRRAMLLEDEDKALAEVLSPLQRAKYHAIQEQIRRRVEQGRGGAPPRKPPI